MRMAAAAALAAARLWASADAQQAAPGGLGIRPAPAQGRPGSEGVRDARSLDQKALGMYEVCAEGCSAECAEYILPMVTDCETFFRATTSGEGGREGFDHIPSMVQVGTG